MMRAWSRERGKRNEDFGIWYAGEDDEARSTKDRWETFRLRSAASELKAIVTAG